MTLLQLIADWIIPTAHAVRIDQLGNTVPGVTEMWTSIKSVLPFSGIAVSNTAPVQFFGAKVLRFVASFITACSILVIIYAGIKIITSRGKDDGMEKGKQLLLYALLGLVFGMVAAVAINYAVLVYQSSIF